MNEIRAIRKSVGMSQFSLARLSGVPRMRLSLFETNQLELTESEEKALRAVLGQAIERRAGEVAAVRKEFGRGKMEDAAPAAISCAPRGRE